MKAGLPFNDVPSFTDPAAACREIKVKRVESGPYDLCVMLLIWNVIALSHKSRKSYTQSIIGLLLASPW